MLGYTGILLVDKNTQWMVISLNQELIFWVVLVLNSNKIIKKKLLKKTSFSETILQKKRFINKELFVYLFYSAFYISTQISVFHLILGLILGY